MSFQHFQIDRKAVAKRIFLLGFITLTSFYPSADVYADIYEKFVAPCVKSMPNQGSLGEFLCKCVAEQGRKQNVSEALFRKQIENMKQENPKKAEGVEFKKLISHCMKSMTPVSSKTSASQAHRTAPTTNINRPQRSISNRTNLSLTQNTGRKSVKLFRKNVKFAGKKYRLERVRTHNSAKEGPIRCVTSSPIKGGIIVTFKEKVLRYQATGQRIPLSSSILDKKQTQLRCYLETGPNQAYLVLSEGVFELKNGILTNQLGSLRSMFVDHMFMLKGHLWLVSVTKHTFAASWNGSKWTEHHETGPISRFAFLKFLGAYGDALYFSGRESIDDSKKTLVYYKGAWHLDNSFALDTTFVMHKKQLFSLSPFTKLLAVDFKTFYTIDKLKLGPGAGSFSKWIAKDKSNATWMTTDAGAIYRLSPL